MMHLWLRAESKAFERRTPLTPEHAKHLVKSGFKVTVEQSGLRVFADDDFAKVGCEMVPTASWYQAPGDAFILGIKELPEDDVALHHTHIYFAHVFKHQAHAKHLLDRFAQGNGCLLDLEYLTDHDHKRVAAFGFWSGVAGAAVSLLLWGQKRQGLQPTFKIPSSFPNEASLLDELLTMISMLKVNPSVMLIGHRGRCGLGVKYLLEKLAIEFTQWGRAQTQNRGPFPELLNYDLLFNCIFVDAPIQPFLTSELLPQNQRLSVIGDISCDPDGDYNPLPIYDNITTFSQPTHRVFDGACPIDVMAIDHLPSFLPRESSESFSRHLLPYLEQLMAGDIRNTPWERAKQVFNNTILDYAEDIL